MTTKGKSAAHETTIRFPDIPEREPDDMTSAKAIHLNGNSNYLRIHFSDRPATIVDAEHYVAAAPTRDMTGIVYPDLLIAFDADPEALARNNAYIISEQGKPPDFILEVASTSSRTRDRTTKRSTYENLGVKEYWRYDDEPTATNPPLAGDELVNGNYRPIAVATMDDGSWRGHSTVLNLILEWREGQLNWIDPKTGEPLPTFEQEREGRLQAEARNRELEAELRRLRGE